MVVLSIIIRMAKQLQLQPMKISRIWAQLFLSLLMVLLLMQNIRALTSPYLEQALLATRFTT